LKEKLLAAQRGGIKTVVIPSENRRDLSEIPDTIKENLDIQPVKWIDEVLQLALVRMPDPLPETPVSVADSAVSAKAQENIRAH
jgi:ATP-dependent Lon protease